MHEQRRIHGLKSGEDNEVERRKYETREAVGREGVGRGKGARPLPRRLGGLGERRELPSGVRG